MLGTWCHTNLSIRNNPQPALSWQLAARQHSVHPKGPAGESTYQLLCARGDIVSNCVTYTHRAVDVLVMPDYGFWGACSFLPSSHLFSFLPLLPFIAPTPLIQLGHLGSRAKHCNFPQQVSAEPDCQMVCVTWWAKENLFGDRDDFDTFCQTSTNL